MSSVHGTSGMRLLKRTYAIQLVHLRIFSHNRADAVMEYSADRLPLIAVDQRSRSDSPIRQSDIARLVCRSGSANLSEPVLDISNVFSAV